jgi:hypothetical protein
MSTRGLKYQFVETANLCLFLTLLKREVYFFRIWQNHYSTLQKKKRASHLLVLVVLPCLLLELHSSLVEWFCCCRLFLQKQEFTHKHSRSSTAIGPLWSRKASQVSLFTRPLFSLLPPGSLVPCLGYTSHQPQNSFDNVWRLTCWRQGVFLQTQKIKPIKRRDKTSDQRNYAWLHLIIQNTYRGKYFEY